MSELSIESKHKDFVTVFRHYHDEHGNIVFLPSNLCTFCWECLYEGIIIECNAPNNIWKKCKEHPFTSRPWGFTEGIIDHNEFHETWLQELRIPKSKHSEED